MFELNYEYCFIFCSVVEYIFKDGKWVDFQALEERKKAESWSSTAGSVELSKQSRRPRMAMGKYNGVARTSKESNPRTNSTATSSRSGIPGVASSGMQHLSFSPPKDLPGTWTDRYSTDLHKVIEEIDDI